jgi:hypothetical protein
MTSVAARLLGHPEHQQRDVWGNPIRDAPLLRKTPASPISLELSVRRRETAASPISLSTASPISLSTANCRNLEMRHYSETFPLELSVRRSLTPHEDYPNLVSILRRWPKSLWQRRIPMDSWDHPPSENQTCVSGEPRILRICSHESSGHSRPRSCFLNTDSASIIKVP